MKEDQEKQLPTGLREYLENGIYYGVEFQVKPKYLEQAKEKLEEATCEKDCRKLWRWLIKRET